MGWVTIRYRLRSSAPLYFHNDQAADPLNRFAKALKQVSAKRSKTDADHEELARLEFMAALYMGPNGPVIPAPMIDATLTNAAKVSREGKLSKSGVFCPEHAPLEYDGPRTAEELWNDERFRSREPVKVGMARVMRTRPVFSEWAAVVTVQVEDIVVNPARLDDWFHIAGTQCGFGDWRPQHGRFTAERLNGG